MFNFFGDNEELFYEELLKENFDESKVQKYLNKGIDLNKKDEKNRTILFNMVDKRKIDAIKFLIKSGVDLYVEDIYGKNVLNEAIDKNDGLILRVLLENGASVNHRNSSKRTILQDVALEGNYKIFQILMNYKPNFDLKDSYGKTIIFDAVESENVEILREIVNNTDNLNVLDENNQTALFSAVLKDNLDIAKTLILNGININFLDKNGQNVLFNTILKGAGNLEILELLIRKGININIIDNYNNNILDEILYIKNLQEEPLKNIDNKYKLLKKGTDYLSITSLLMENGLEIDKIDENGQNTLMKAVKEENFTNIAFLVSCGANINVEDENAQTLLEKEIMKGYSNYKMIDFLIKHGADIERKNLDNQTIVDILVEIILNQKKYKQNSEILSLIDENEDYERLLKKVLSYKPKIDTRREDGKTLLFDLVLYNDYETLKHIINYGIDLNIKDKNGDTALSFMVEEGLKISEKRLRELFLERLVFFLKFRVNVDIQNNQGRTVYHKAVIADDLEVVEKLLTKKANLSLKDKHGRTALHHTKWKGNYKIARWLIAAGADINQPDNSGFTLLNYAAIFGHLKLVITLIASGVYMYNKNPKNKKVAQFFKQKESNLDILLSSNISDDKMNRAVIEVVENLKNEIDEAIRG